MHAQKILSWFRGSRLVLPERQALCFSRAAFLLAVETGTIQQLYAIMCARNLNPHNVLGAEITVSRKGRDNYCFVEFASTEEAKNFMAKHNHQPLREYRMQ